MRSSSSAALLLGLLTGMLPSPVAAQNLTVQQPVFGVNSVGTTVSVPDRGSALLGGVSSAGASRSRYGFGPFRPGSTSGQFYSASSSSVSVTIHDFAEMDRYLNSQTDFSRSGPSFGGRESRLTGGAAEAWRRLEARSTAASAYSPAYSASAAPAGSGVSSRLPAGSVLSPSRSLPPATGTSATDEPARVSTAHRSLELGRAALERGSRNVARMHFRMAVRRGSQAAREELARLKSASRPRSVAGASSGTRAE